MSPAKPDTSTRVQHVDRADVYTLEHWQESAPNHAERWPKVPVCDPRDIPGLGIEELLGRHIKPQPDGCWYWNGDADYRGRIQWNGKSWVAYRLIYCFFHHLPALPRGWHIHHRCQNPGCVNPDHLELLTRAQHLAAHDLIRELTRQRCRGYDGHSCAKDVVSSGRCDACRRYVQATTKRLQRHAAKARP